VPGEDGQPAATLSARFVAKRRVTEPVQVQQPV
jgi:hypothetical protein